MGGDNHEPTGLARFVPMLRWLPRYDRALLRGDVVAGLSVWALAAPGSLAYAGVAGVPVQYGLYAMPLALIGYAVFGTSGRLFVGPGASVAALSAAIVAPLAATAGGDRFIALTAALAILVGVFYVIAGLLRLGFLANFFAKPVLSGFILGLGLFIVVGQVPKLVGIEKPAGDTVAQAVRIVANVDNWSWATVVVGMVALVLLFGMHRRAPRLPAVLIVAALGIAVSAVIGLDDDGVAVVGEVPTGFTMVSWGSVSLDDLVSMVPGALGILVVGFAQSMAIAKTLAAKHHESTDPSQEMIAYGAANVGAGALGGFAVTGSLGKSAAAEAAGGRTSLVSVTVGLATVLTIVFLVGVFEPLPETVLAAIVIQAVWGMIDIDPLLRLWRSRTLDFWLAATAMLGVILIGLLPGILIGVVLSLALFQHRVNTPHSAILGRRPDGEAYGDIAEHVGYTTDPGVLVYRWDAPLMFANADHFATDLATKLAAQVGTRWVVIDCEACFHIDTTGASTLEAVHDRLADEGVTVHLARVHAEVRSFLHRLGTLEVIGADRVHGTVRDAVANAVASSQRPRLHGAS